MPFAQKLKVATIRVPNVVEICGTDTGQKVLCGVQGFFLRTVLTHLRLEYEIVSPADNEWGRLGENGNWSGLIGMVNREEADISVNTLVLTEQRMRAVSFSIPFEQSGMTFIAHKPEDLHPTMAYFYPFDVTTWFYLFTTLLLVSILFTIVQNGNEPFNCIIMKLFGSLLLKSFHLKVHSKKWKTLALMWSFFGLVISISYSGALLSFLTVPLQGARIRNFKQLSEAVQKGTHKCYALRGSHHVPFLLGSREEHLQMLGKAIVQHNWYFDANDVGTFNHVSYNSIELQSFSPMVDELNSEFDLSDDLLSLWHIGFIMNKNFSHKKKLDTLLSRMLAAGFREKFWRDEKARIRISKIKNVFKTQGLRALSLGDLSGIFILFLIGLALSFFVFISEVLLARHYITFNLSPHASPLRHLPDSKFQLERRSSVAQVNT